MDKCDNCGRSDRPLYFSDNGILCDLCRAEGEQSGTYADIKRRQANRAKAERDEDADI